MATPYSGRGATPYIPPLLEWRPLQQRYIAAAVAMAHSATTYHTVTHITLSRVETTNWRVYTMW